MSVQTTVEIARQDAIDRIWNILFLIAQKDYLAIEQVSHEPDNDVQIFVDECPLSSFPSSKDALAKWTNKMLERKMDEPFFRVSVFDNYRVVS